MAGNFEEGQGPQRAVGPMMMMKTLLKESSHPVFQQLRYAVRIDFRNVTYTLKGKSAPVLN
jgi:hypothetical protein